MTLPLTSAQKQIILATGNVLVDAGAGSGKTTTVVQLLLHCLGVPVRTSDGTIPGASPALALADIAAITFTNAAAADLARKLRAALRDAGEGELATDVDAARLGTIHSFCGDLLRRYALRAQLPPGQRVLTDAEAEALGTEAARDVVHAALESPTGPGLAALLGGRRLVDVIAWVAKAASDQDRLERWSAGKDAGLRPHELALLELAERAVTERVSRLAELGALDFDRMIVGARDLLRHADVRHAVQRRLRLLVIDEFQDVDPAQQEIAMLLGGLEHDDPQPTRLVLVGDPKQSIYRFRRADVTLWGRTAARFAGGAGALLPLHDNFRSKAAILGFVDHTVGRLLDRPLEADGERRAYEVAFTPLTPLAAHRDGDEAVELHLLPPDDKGKPLTANRVREREAPAIAARLLALAADGHRWADIAILVGSWNAAVGLERALRDAGIPSYVPRGEGFWQAREVLDALLALRAVRDPLDDTAVMGVLKSPLCGVRDETLLHLARSRGGVPLVEAANALVGANALPVDEASRLARGVDLIARYAALRDRLPAAELLDRMLAETGYLAALALAEQGAQAIANLRKLRRMLQHARDRSLGEFLRDVREARAREDAVAAERLYGERGNVVTITTVHSAKGLEWDVVVLANLAAQLQEPTDAFLPGRETIAIRAAAEDEDDKIKDAWHEEAKARESSEKAAERLRTWYVGMTRAKHRLILFTLPLGEVSRPRSAAQFLLTVLPELAVGMPYPYRSRSGNSFRALVRMADAVAPARAAATRASTALPLPPNAIAAPAGSSRLSATQLMTHAKDPAEWRRVYLDRVPQPNAEPAAREESRALQRAIVTGQVVHQVLERLADDAVDVEAVLEEALDVWDDAAPASTTATGSALRAMLRARIATVAEAPAWREVAELPGARRELAFTRLLPDGTAIVGALDLVALGATRARVVDVKASTASPPELARRYAVQAAVYLDAVRAISGAAEATFTLISATNGESVEVVPTANVSELVATLRRES